MKDLKVVTDDIKVKAEDVPIRVHIGDEKTLLEKYEVDLIVCKNSGGEATKAKLDAASELGIRV
jgi:precorrin-6x reductase